MSRVYKCAPLPFMGQKRYFLRDFGRAKQRGEKISYVVACLAKQYNMSERSVYDIVKRLGNDCKAASL